MSIEDLTIRPAIAADQAIISRLIVQHQLNPLGTNWHDFLVVQDEEEKFVGCGQIKHHNDVDELASLMVIDDWQGQGVSRMLIEALVKKGRKPLWLTCESRLTDYYRKFGFEEVTTYRKLPVTFQRLYWFTRTVLGPMLWLRGTYVAFMVLGAE